jgi:acid phosphatase type 7
LFSSTSDVRSAGPNRAVLVGAGDIAACSSRGDEATALLLGRIGGTVFTAGDNAYPSGTSADFTNRYEPTWGRHKDRPKPSVGNHECNTPVASGYFDYFGQAAGARQRLLQL